MCLVGLAQTPNDDVSLIIAANRDEFFEREADPAGPWVDAPHVVAGRDRRGGGTWLGVSQTGRVAALTNWRNPAARREGKSRGDLPRRWLTSDTALEAFLDEIRSQIDVYPSFNLIVGWVAGPLVYVNEQGVVATVVPAGVHALSNDRFDVAWPKVDHLRSTLRDVSSLPREELSPALFRALRASNVAPDDALPSTGVPLDLERALSPAFISGQHYGTRCSTVLIATCDGRVTLEEQSFGPMGVPTTYVAHSFSIARGQ